MDAELEELPADMLSRFHYISQLVEEFGLERVRGAYLEHLRATIGEIRIKGKDGISRALCVTAVGKCVVVVRVFIRKTQKTPSREIDLAPKRAKEIKP